VSAWHTDVATDIDVGVVVRTESPELGGAVALDASVLTGRTWQMGPYLRGRHDFALRASGGGGVAFAFPIGEVTVLAPSAGALTDGTAGFSGRVFVGGRGSVPADGSFRIDLASFGLSLEARALVDGRRDAGIFLTGNPVALVLLPIGLGLWIATGHMPGH
jgi:hypothetical protein